MKYLPVVALVLGLMVAEAPAKDHAAPATKGRSATSRIVRSISTAAAQFRTSVEHVVSAVRARPKAKGIPGPGGDGRGKGEIGAGKHATPPAGKGNPGPGGDGRGKGEVGAGKHATPPAGKGNPGPGGDGRGKGEIGAGKHATPPAEVYFGRN